MTEVDRELLTYEAARWIRSLAGELHWNIREDSRKLIIYALADVIYSSPEFEDEFQEGFADPDEITAVLHWAFDLSQTGRASLPDYLELHEVKKKWKAQPFWIDASELD